MKRISGDEAFKIHPFVYFMGTILLLTLPLRWLLASFLSALIHELCHIAATKICGGTILDFRIGIGGAEIITDPMPYWMQIICILAGPLGSFALIFLFEWLPLTSVCGLIQGAFNILPILPLDGGRILLCVLESAFDPPKASTICRVIECITICVISLLALLCAFAFHFGIWPVIMTSILSINVISRKIPCKPSQLGVQ